MGLKNLMSDVLIRQEGNTRRRPHDDRDRDRSNSATNQ